MARDDEVEEMKVNRSRKHARGNVGGSSDNDEDDDEGNNEYEADGFIVDDVDEEDDLERQKKRKKKKRAAEKHYVLDDDDYELLEDNNITGFRRPSQESNKFKRLKKAKGNTSEGHSGAFNKKFSAGSGTSRRTAEEELKRNLLGDDEEPVFEDIAKEDQTKEVDEDEYGEEDDEMADFIVDEEEGDEHGALLRQKKSNKKKYRQATGVSAAAMQEAYEIFGDVKDTLRRREVVLKKMNTGNGNTKKKCICGSHFSKPSKCDNRHQRK